MMSCDSTPRNSQQENYWYGGCWLVKGCVSIPFARIELLYGLKNGYYKCFCFGVFELASIVVNQVLESISRTIEFNVGQVYLETPDLFQDRKVQ